MHVFIGINMKDLLKDKLSTINEQKKHPLSLQLINKSSAGSRVKVHARSQYLNNRFDKGARWANLNASATFVPVCECV